MTDFLSEARALFKENSIQLGERDIFLYGNAFEIISSLIHGKLTTREIFEAFDFLSDLILNKKHQYGFIRRDDRIKAQIQIMEEIPQIAGKLTPEEKEALAFCVYHATCVRVFNEDTNKVVTGLTDFTSLEHILQCYEDAKRIRLELFE